MRCKTKILLFCDGKRAQNKAAECVVKSGYHVKREKLYHAHNYYCIMLTNYMNFNKEMRRWSFGKWNIQKLVRSVEVKEIKSVR